VYVWEWFLAISARRSSSGFGPSPITWLDIDAWQRVTGIFMATFERDWIFELDRMFLDSASAEIKRRQLEPKPRIKWKPQ
jgi:hypothetical protein